MEQPDAPETAPGIEDFQPDPEERWKPAYSKWGFVALQRADDPTDIESVRSAAKDLADELVLDPEEVFEAAKQQADDVEHVGTL